MRSLILGPPGTGKTTRLVQELEQLLEEGVDPSMIAFLTYTRAARDEILERLSGRGLSGDDVPWARTIHSAAFKLLGLGCGDILGPGAWDAFAKSFSYKLSRLSGPGDVDGPRGRIPRQTRDDRLRYVHEWSRAARVPLERAAYSCHGPRVSVSQLRTYVSRYDRFKRESGCIDYSDLLEVALEEGLCPDVSVLLLDEAQDLSPLQVELVSMWSQGRRAIVAGDEDQTIYSWSGADPRWLIDLSRTTMTEVLRTSQRIPRAVHRMAIRIVSRNRDRIDKAYEPRDADGSARRLDGLAAFRELDGSKDTFVLARNKIFLAEPAKVLIRRRIPFIVEGVSNGSPMNDPALRRAVRAAIRLGRGETVDAGSLLALLEWANRSLVPDGSVQSIKKLRADLQIGSTMLRYAHGLGALADAIDRDGPCSVLAVSSEDRAYLRALVEKYGDLPRPRVCLTTIHRAKGREAMHVVVLPDMTPASYRAYRGRPEEREAENRLAYVAVTRAKESLVVVRPRTSRFYDYPLT